MGRTSNAKENLIQSAIELIGATNYNSVGVQELCDHAGVKKGSFYHFFPSKRDLTLEAIDIMWGMFKSSILDPVCTADIPPMRKFQLLLDESEKAQKCTKEILGCSTGCHIGNLALELSTQDQVIREKVQHVFNEWTDCIEGVVKEAVADGSFPSDTDTRKTAKSMLAYVEGMCLLVKTFDDVDLIRELGECIPQLIVRKKQNKARAVS